MTSGVNGPIGDVCYGTAQSAIRGTSKYALDICEEL
jgi:hypothetical protein